MRPRQWRAESAPHGWNRVKVSEYLGATLVAPVAPVDTSLWQFVYFQAAASAHLAVLVLWVEKKIKIIIYQIAFHMTCLCTDIQYKNISWNRNWMRIRIKLQKLFHSGIFLNQKTETSKEDSNTGFDSWRNSGIFPALDILDPLELRKDCWCTSSTSFWKAWSSDRSMGANL